jgi:hemerythrin-like domain-containing protein
MNETQSRRRFLAGAGVLAVAGSALAAGRSDEKEPEVAPAEDLMREHGVLRRVVLVYREIGRRNDAREEVPLDALSSAAGIIRRVIENYHEKLEEDFVFPRMEKAGKLTGLVKVLLAQHRAGSVVTDRILAVGKGRVRDDGARRELASALTSFIRMYEPHAAREDTDLFPAFHDLMGDRAYRELGDAFEEREKKVLGENGFEGAVKQVARLEEALGIHDLAKFTP